MRSILLTAVKQGIIILVAAVAVSLIVNRARNDRIPLVAQAETFRVRTDAEFMKAEDAQRLFEDGMAMFVDAREPEVYAVRHVEGAINIPASAGDVEGMAWLANVETHVICYSSQANQRQAGVIADRLLQMGCKEVRILYGGMEAWVDRGLPVEEMTD